MSIILDTPLLRPLEFINTKLEKPKISWILLISIGIILASLLLIYGGILYTEGVMKQYSACRDKIIGYEQQGLYTSTEGFKLTLSFCELR